MVASAKLFLPGLPLGCATLSQCWRMSVSNKLRSIIVLVVMAAGAGFLAYIFGLTDIFAWGLAAGAFVTGMLAGIVSWYQKGSIFDRKPINRTIKHPIISGAVGGFITYLSLFVIPAYVTMFLLGAGLGFFVVGAVILIVRDIAAGEA
jgi:hypothetical protein